MPLASLKFVNFSYPQSNRKTLNDINFEINGGEYVAVVGTNGSGKSTFARLLAGFIKPDSGEAVLDNDVLPGIVFQQPKEQIVAGVVSRDTAFGPQNLSMSKSEIELRTMECLSVTGLLDRASSRTFELSLGQTQRLALSGILALFPDLLILDEVTAMLDPVAREEILSLLDSWNHKLHTIIHITHDKDEVLRAKRVVALDEGQIVFDGSVKDFFETKSICNKIFGDEFFDFKSSAEDKNVSDENEISLFVENLSFSYPENSVFENISFSLKKGSLTALTGPSGCGKSTLLETLAGLHKPLKGSIYSSVRPVLALQESEAALFEPFASDDVAFGPRNQGLAGRQLVNRVKEAMNLADLPFDSFAERQTFSLSGGEKRRLSLAGIIALDSDILLFDEPTAGLDPEARKNVMTTLRLLAKKGKTVLFSTHRMEEAHFADRNISWKELTSGTSVCKENTSSLKLQTSLPNSEMLSALQKTSAAFMAPPSIPASAVNRMTPLFKYLVFLTMFVASLAVRPFYLTAALFAASIIYALFAKLPLRKPAAAFVKIFPWLIIFAFFQFLFFPAKSGEEILFKLGLFTISSSKIFLVAAMIIRTASAIVCISTFIFTTSEREILDGLDSLLKPLSVIKIPVRYFILAVGIMFRFIPLLLDEAAGILKVQLVRGGLGKAKGFKKVKILLPLFVPLMIQSFRKAESLADALTARYFC